MYCDLKEHLYSFIKCFQGSIDVPKWTTYKNEHINHIPKHKKSISGKKNPILRTRQSSQKEIKGQIPQFIERTQQAQSNQKKKMLYEIYSDNAFIKKSSCISNNSNLKIIDSKDKRSSKQISFIYPPLKQSIKMINSKEDTTINTNLENIQHSTYLFESEITIFKMFKQEKKKKIEPEQSNDVHRENYDNKKLISIKKKKLEMKDKEAFEKMFEQNLTNKCLIQSKNKGKNSTNSSQKYNSSFNQTLNFKILNDILSGEKIVQSIADSDQQQSLQESFVQKIHGPNEGQIISLFQL